VLRERLNEALRTATEADDRCAMAIVRLIDAALEERDQKARAEGEPQGLADGDLMACSREWSRSAATAYGATGECPA
jgi:uncharacterized protein YqeY